jgi:hypothetical protein
VLLRIYEYWMWEMTQYLDFGLATPALSVGNMDGAMAAISLHCLLMPADFYAYMITLDSPGSDIPLSTLGTEAFFCGMALQTCFDICDNLLVGSTVWALLHENRWDL